MKRQIEECMEAIKLHDTPDQLFEREYYFDETLGESLNEHTE
jgi:hypothetical protein